MESNSNHVSKQEIIDFFNKYYPDHYKIEFNFYMDLGLVVKFANMYLYDVELNKKEIISNFFFNIHEQNVICLIDHANIVTDDDISKQIKGTVTIKYREDKIDIDFYEIEQSDNYLGTFKI